MTVVGLQAMPQNCDFT